uniref:Uncharacterized protein n=1 Tax=Ixodes ricinus TaxID=34613 RepID=A0A6B0UD45_IXORI
MGRSLTSRFLNGLLLVLSFRLLFFFFFSRDYRFVSKTNFYSVISIVFFSRGYTTTSRSLVEEMRKQREVSFSPSFYFVTDVSNCKVCGRVIQVG